MASPEDKNREVAVRAASKSLGELLDTDPDARMILAENALPTRDGYIAAIGAACKRDGSRGLSAEKRRRLLQIAGLDLAGQITLEEVGRALADLADACLDSVLRYLDAPEDFSVVAMGKLGARELNYVSDIDVMFVTSGDVEQGVKAAEQLLSSIGDVGPHGRTYEIDPNLRPEGRSGVLVRSLESALEYYRRWAQPWEYQALIKARPCAGALAVAEALVEQTRPLVFSDVSAERISDIRRMKARVEEHAARASRRGRRSSGEDVKLGPGGIRDIEFSVQLLQLVHGGSDFLVRAPATLDAIDALVDGGYVAEEDGAGLSVAYRWHRTVEHRLQLWLERRVHRLPTDEEALTRLAKTLGFRATPAKSAAERFENRHAAVLSDVRARFERLFYRPMIESLAEGAEIGLSAEGLRDRLRVLGFRDVERAARTLNKLVGGTSRRAKLFRLLTPAFLRFVASTPLPDDGLFAFLTLGEVLGDRLDVLGALRDNPPAIELLARVLGSGRLLGEVLQHVPEELSSIAASGSPESPRSKERLVREAIASLEWREPDRRLDGLRRFKRREMLRVALADVGGRVAPAPLGSALADLADACLEAGLTDAVMPFSVIGMGKLGGRELNYASDIDVMFVHDGDPQQAERLAEELMKAIGEVTPEGQAFRIDAALRPEGKAGVLARSFDSYMEYYDKWAKPWEFQALIKARVAAGDEALGQKLVEATRRLAFPEKLSQEGLAEMRHLKARMEKERIPRGADPRMNIKLGPGGLTDVEFSVQVMQRQHGQGEPELRVAGTMAALDALQRVGLLDEDDSTRLRQAYTLLTRIRNRLFFMFGKPVDALPTRPEDAEALGVGLGYGDQPRQELEEHYLRTTRRARKVAERLIYG